MVRHGAGDNTTALTSRMGTPNAAAISLRDRTLEKSSARAGIGVSDGEKDWRWARGSYDDTIVIVAESVKCRFKNSWRAPEIIISRKIMHD